MCFATDDMIASKSCLIFYECQAEYSIVLERLKGGVLSHRKG